MFEEHEQNEESWKLDNQYVKVTPIQFIKILKTWYPDLSLKFAKNIMDELWRHTWKKAEAQELALALEKARDRIEAELDRRDRRYSNVLYAIHLSNITPCKITYQRNPGNIAIECRKPTDADKLAQHLDATNYIGSNIVTVDVQEN